MKVYCVMQEQEGGYVGGCLIEIFTTAAAATKFIEINQPKYETLTVEEFEMHGEM